MQQKLRCFGNIYSLNLHCMNCFSYCYGNIPIKKPFKERGVYSGLQCGGINSIMVGETWQQKLESAGHIHL